MYFTAGGHRKERTERTTNNRTRNIRSVIELHLFISLPSNVKCERADLYSDKIMGYGVNGNITVGGLSHQLPLFLRVEHR